MLKFCSNGNYVLIVIGVCQLVKRVATLGAHLPLE